MERGKFTLDDTGGSELGDSAVSAAFLGATGDSGDNGGSSGGNSGELERDSNGELWDAERHSASRARNADGTWRGKRGRKSGSGSAANSGSRKKADNQASIEALTRALVIVHLGISKATSIPELELETDDADTLARATANVLSEFDIRPDPKVEAIFALIVAAGSVYAPKVILYRKRVNEENNKPKPSNVIYEMPSVHMNG